MSVPDIVLCPIVIANNGSWVGGRSLYVGQTISAGGAGWVPFKPSLSASTGGSYTYSLNSGSLPSGLSINSANGKISGTIGGSAGVYTFQIKIVNATISYSAIGSFSVYVFTSDPSVNYYFQCASDYTTLVTGQACALPFNYFDSGSNPLFSVSSLDALPSGLSIYLDPVNTALFYLIGTPSSAGYYSFRLQTTNSVGTTAIAMVNLQVMSVQNYWMSIPPAIVGTAYSFTWNQSFFDSAYQQMGNYASFSPYATSSYASISAGGHSIGGLSQSSAGVLSGTPTSFTAGDNIFRISFTITGTSHSVTYAPYTTPPATPGNLHIEQIAMFSTAPPSVVVPPAWLVTNEPFDTSPPTSPNFVDRSQYIDFNDGAQNTFQLMMRQRGRATIPFRVKANDSYVPTMGMQVYLFDDTPTGWTMVFAGSIDDCVLTYFGLRGDRLYTVTAVTFDQCLDVVMVPPQTFGAASNTGYIVTTLFNALMSGAPISLGTIQTSVTIGTPYTIADWTPLSQVIDDLATISQFVWGVNYQNLTLYFQLPFTLAAPFTLATKQVRNPGGKPSWSWRNKRQDYRNRQINKIAASAFSPSSELFTSGGSSFTLARPPATVTDAWVTQNTQNSARATLSSNPSSGDTVTISYPTAGSIYNWAANSPYATGQIIVDPAGHIQKVTTQGTSGATIPTFSDTTTGGGTTTDGPGTPDPPPFNGAVIWTDQGIAGGGLYDAVVYTFVTVLDNTQWGQVLIGASAAATAQNLADAINSNQSVAGISFSWPTWENPLLNAGTVGGSAFTVYNKAAGAGYIAALSKTGTAFSWSASTTSGGSTSAVTTYVLQVAQNGQSNTANLYYTPGSTTVALASIPQSAVGLPLSGGWNLQVQYTRQGGDTIVCERSDLVAARAIIEGGTGKYQAKTSDTNQVNAQLGLLECQEDLAAYDTLPVELTFATFIPGLTTGQYLNISVSDVPVGVAALINGQYVIQEIRAKLIRTKPWMNQRTVPGGGHYEYTVTVINVGVIGSYLDFWKGNLGGGNGATSSVVGLAGGGASPAGSGTVAGTVTPTAQSANLAGAGRGLGTIYQNTTAKPIFVSVTATGSSTVALAAVSDSSATPTAPVATTAMTGNVSSPPTSYTASVFFLVIAGNYYEVSTSAGSTLTSWFEWT